MTDQSRFDGALRDVQDLMKRSDVIGMDVAGMEHYKFNKEGQQRFVATYDALSAVAKQRGEPVVLRPHVGEDAVISSLEAVIARPENAKYGGRPRKHVACRYAPALNATPATIGELHQPLCGSGKCI
jgi:hypothetical protein